MKKTIHMAAMALSALLCFTAGAIEPVYKVTMKEGTEDAGNWTIDLEVTYYTDDEVAALDVDALIDAIGEVAFTPESEALIDAARKAYDALTPDQKAFVAKYETLTAAETAYFEAKMLDAGFVVKDGVLIEYIGEGGDVVIPEGVMAIGERVFSTNIVTSVTMPNSVTNIYDTAFSACVNLSNVTFGAGVDIIGNWAFSGCRKLMSLTFKGDAPTTVANDAFSNVPWDAVVYVQPDAEGWDPVPGLWQDRAMVYEGEEVPEFIVNDGVLLLYTGEGGDVAVPDGVTSIYDYAFWRKGISSVEIPAGVTNFGESAFSDCHDLTNVTVGADATGGEATRVFSFRKTDDEIPVTVKLPQTINLKLAKNGEETLNASLVLKNKSGKTYQVFRDDAYSFNISLEGTIKGKAIEFTADMEHTSERSYELKTALAVDGENVLGIKAEGVNTPYDDDTLETYTGILENAGGVWSALGKVLGFVNGKALDSLEITIRDNIVIAGSVDEIGGMLAGLAQMVGSDEEVTNEQIDAIVAALNANVKYTVTQKNTGITAEGSFVAGDLFGAYLPLVALQFEGEEEAQPIVSRLTEDDWENVARVLVVGVKAAGDVATADAKVYKASGSATLIPTTEPDEVTGAFDGKVVVYLAPNAKKNFEGFYDEVYVAWDGEKFNFINE